MKLWITNEYEHNGLRADGENVVDRLLKMTRGGCDRSANVQPQRESANENFIRSLSVACGRRAHAPVHAGPQEDAASALDRFHSAAAKADFDAYCAFTPDGVSSALTQLSADCRAIKPTRSRTSTKAVVTTPRSSETSTFRRRCARLLDNCSTTRASAAAAAPVCCARSTASGALSNTTSRYLCRMNWRTNL